MNQNRIEWEVEKRFDFFGGEMHWFFQIKFNTDFSQHLLCWLWFTKMKVFCFKCRRWLSLIYSNNVCGLWLLETKQGIVSCQNKGQAWKKCYRCCIKCKPAVIFCECLQSAKTFSSALKRRRYFAYSTEQATFMQATWYEGE